MSRPDIAVAVMILVLVARGAVSHALECTADEAKDAHVLLQSKIQVGAMQSTTETNEDIDMEVLDLNLTIAESAGEGEHLVHKVSKASPCTNTPGPWMASQGLKCESFKWMYRNRCNAASKINRWRRVWVAKKYCQQSCWDNGNGYDGDFCGKASQKSTTTATSCTNTPGPWMISRGFKCETFKWMYGNRCNANSTINRWRHVWVAKKYCQQSCWDNGNGYDGDDCGTAVSNKVQSRPTTTTTTTTATTITTTTTTKTRWSCDRGRNFIVGANYAQQALTDYCPACSANPVYGGANDVKKAVAYCKRKCIAGTPPASSTCVGFFFQRHNNGHEICGFYNKVPTWSAAKWHGGTLGWDQICQLVA